jgi:PKD repeat protein
MKKISLFQVLIVVIFFTAVVSCKKKEIIDVYKPVTCFTARVPNTEVSNRYPGYATLIDSFFSFRNCSDSGDNVSYHWDFGDGTTSDEKNPMHKYTRRGAYQVTLGVTVQENGHETSDTVQHTVWVALGAKNISSPYPVAIEETDTGFVLVCKETSPYTYYELYELDSLLNFKKYIYIPSGYRLNTLQLTSDGNYIFTGNTQGTNKNNELIKLKKDGTLLWSKVFATEDTYTYMVSTPDGGYALVGSRPGLAPNGSIQNITVVIKTDNNGNQQWQKFFDQEIMLTTGDAVVDQSGIVLAGVLKNNGSCSTCDTLMITKLDLAGNLVWKNTMLWGLNRNIWAGTYITRFTNGNYGVRNGITNALYYFNPSGNFVDRIFMPTTFTVNSITNTSDGKLVMLRDPDIIAFTPDGLVQWNYENIGKTGIALRRLRNGGMIMIGTQSKQGRFFYYDVSLLIEVNDAGQPM